MLIMIMFKSLLLLNQAKTLIKLNKMKCIRKLKVINPVAHLLKIALKSKAKQETLN